MSGIAAVVHRDGRPASERDVSAMLAAAPYRGPDGSSVRQLGTACLGHLKMSVTHEDDRDCQPLISNRTGCAIVADVRLDNRQELLSLLAPSQGTWSDAELILRAYEMRGTEVFAKLLGDFAFVIWDPRRMRLVAARDTSGQRTLFYRIDSRTVAVGSEIQQLFADPAIPVRPNETRIREFLVPCNALMNEKDDPLTFYEGVFAIPAGNVLTVDSNSVELRRYWEFPAHRELRYRTKAEYVDHYFALLLEVVRGRLRSSRPIGALLSGGLDSSSIVCAVQELYRTGRAAPNNLLSFTLIFDGFDCDERVPVQEIQAMHGFAARFVPYSDGGVRLDLAPRGFQESPNMSPRAPRDALLGAVAETGVRVLLTGDVADACVSGSPLFLDTLLRSGRFIAFSRHLARFRNSVEPIHKTLLFQGLAPLLPLGLQRRLDRLRARRVLSARGTSILPGWMPKELRAELAARHSELSLERISARRYSSPARQSEFAMLYPPEVARHPAPWPIEFARPFADRRLHEFLLAIPPEEKFTADAPTSYAASKRLTREAMRGLLPESVRASKSKVGFSKVFESEISRHWRDYEDTFGPSGQAEIVRRGYVDREQFWARLQALREGESRPDKVYVMHLVGLETWFRTLRLPRPELVTVAAPAEADFAVSSRTRAPALSVA